MALAYGTAFGQPAPPVTILNTFNTAEVYDSPSRKPVFVLHRPGVITLIQTYHWNSGKGAPGGTISLEGQDGRVYGPWNVTTSGGSGAENIFWTCQPNLNLPAGAYTVLDSEPVTWSQNVQSIGYGFALVQGTTRAQAAWTRGKTLAQAEVVPTAEDQTFTFPEGIKVTVPSGLVSSPALLSVSDVEGAPPYPHRSWATSHLYDISLGGLTRLPKPVTIELPFDPTKLSRRYPARDIVEAVYFDDDLNEWVHLPGRIGPAGNSLVVTTRHLCPYGLMYVPVESDRPNDRAVTLYWGPDGKYKLTVLWEDTPAFRQATKGYNFTYQATSDDPSMPPYIRQIARAAWEAVQAYSKLGFQPASESIHIYVEPIESSYHSALTHNIVINLGALEAGELSYVVSHELFHNFQSSEYYLGGVLARRWWLEATAEYASSRIAQPNYPAMGKIDPAQPAISLAPMLTRRPLDYAYLHKGWLEGAIDKISGQNSWDQFHAYRGAFFLDYALRAGTWLAGQKGQATNPKAEFAALWTAVVTTSVSDEGFNVLVPMHSFFEDRYGLGFPDIYGLFAAHFYLHKDSPVGRVAPVTEKELLGNQPLTMSMPVALGPVAPYRAVKVEKKMQLECRLDAPGQANSEAWVFVLPGGQALSGHFVKDLWQNHLRPVEGKPVTFQANGGDVIYVIGVCPAHAGAGVGDPATILRPPLTVTLSPESGEGYWTLQASHSERKIREIEGLSVNAGAASVQANWQRDEVWQGRSIHSEARARASWTPFPAQVKGGDVITVKIQPELTALNLSNTVSVRTKLFAQMLEIRPSHLTTAADSVHPAPAATTFEIKMPRIDKSVTIPITLTVDTSFAGQVIYTYEYRWVMPKKP